MVIVLYFDNKYFHFAKPLIDSIKIYEPSSYIYINSINLSNEQIQMLMSYSPLIFIKNEKMNFDINISDAYNKDLNKDNPLRFQITCKKSNYLLDAMNHFPNEDLFVLTDVDTLMVNPLNELKRQMEKFDIAIHRVSDTKICGGFMAANSNEYAKKFLQMVSDLTLTGRLYFCKDQICLAQIYEETKYDIRFLQVSRKYLDHTCDNNSFLWSGHKSSYGTKNEKYQKYLNKLQEIQ